MGTMPKMIEVESTCVEAIGYEPETRLLFVRFRETRVTYIYADVEDRVHRDFLGAESKGTYLNEVIKPNYAFRKR